MRLHFGLILTVFAVGCSMVTERDSSQAQNTLLQEQHRILIENKKDGKIKGSKNGGITWETLGSVKLPINGGIWQPSVQSGVLAFDYFRGPSNVFGAAVNALHLRFSDPANYSLDADVTVPPIHGQGVSILPKEALAGEMYRSESHIASSAVTDIPGGTKIFGKEWSPRTCSSVFISKGEGTSFEAIPRDSKITPGQQILIKTQFSKFRVEYIEFENKKDGKVLVKRSLQLPKTIAKVTKPVEGVGRFEGSEYAPFPGSVRANHAGVLDVATTDKNISPNLTGQESVKDLRGGFQVVPSFHFQDPSMLNGRDHPFVYLVVAPLEQTETPVRYDMGLEGTDPLFCNGFRPGTAKTYFKIKGENGWYEIQSALKKGKLKDKQGKVITLLRGIQKEALHLVSHIRIVNAE